MNEVSIIINGVRYDAAYNTIKKALLEKETFVELKYKR